MQITSRNIREMMRSELIPLVIKKISISSLASQVGLHDGVLMLRPKASEMFSLSLKQPGYPMNGDVLICDLSGINDCSGSFVDEFILGWQRLIRDRDNTLLILTNMTEDVEYTIVSALNLRNKLDHDNLVLVAQVCGKYQVLGDKMERNVLDVFDLMIDSEKVTARAVADRFSIELNGAGNRLKKLYDAHAAMRLEQSVENGGKFEYYIPRI